MPPEERERERCSTSCDAHSVKLCTVLPDGFVPSALSEPRGSIYSYDNRCTEKAVRYWQFASVVVEEGGEAHTINLRQQCYNEQFVQQGKPRLEMWQWIGVVEKKHIVGECRSLWEMSN